MKLCPILAALLFVPLVPALAGDITGTASVIDGDTLDIHGERIRLHGIDAPESGQSCLNGSGASYRCGQTAALALSDFIGRGTVSCDRRDTDRYGRIVAVCRKGETDLNAWMVSNGLAVAYRQYSVDYVEAEAAARAGKIGIWEGSFDYPWDWRRGGNRSSGRQPDISAQPNDGAGGNFTCGAKRTCRQMASCAEARFYLNACGLSRLEGDRDGIPCEAICR